MDFREGVLVDGATRFAALVPSATVDGAVSLQLAAPTIITRDVARSVVETLTPVLAAPLDVGDELIRAEARRAGWSGLLRGPLTVPAPGAAIPPAALDPIEAVAALLPGTTVARRGFGRRVLTMRAESIDGLHLRVKVPDRDDVVPEQLAGAVDTAFGIRRRFGRMASGVHAITIDDGAGTYDDHSTLGSAQSGTGTFFLDTMLACADNMDAQRRRMGGRAGVSATPPRPWFAIDGVVAHEYWHNLDSTVVATPAIYVELNRLLGEELGVDTYEHALRGREATAPPEWQQALSRILSEVSPYATTNWRESTAELFKLWWCRPPDRSPAPLVARFGALLDRFFPAPIEALGD